MSEDAEPIVPSTERPSREELRARLRGKVASARQGPSTHRRPPDLATMMLATGVDDAQTLQWGLDVATSARSKTSVAPRSAEDEDEEAPPA
jgi:hypothetical protein